MVKPRLMGPAKARGGSTVRPILPQISRAASMMISERPKVRSRGSSGERPYSRRMRKRSMRSPSVPTRSGARTSASQKFLVSPSRENPTNAPSMYSEPWAKFTTVISPKMSDSPVASSTKIIPSTRPVKTCAASADSEMSITTSSEALLGAGAVQLFVGRHLGDDLDEAPVALRLVAALDDPEGLEGLVVAGAPPLLALVVVVDGALAERLGHLLGVGGLGELAAAGDLHDAIVSVAAVVAGRHVELLLESLDVALHLRDRVLQLPVEIGAAVDVGVELGAALLELGQPVQRLGDAHLLLHAVTDGLLEEGNVVGPRRDRHEHLGLGRLDLREMGRELGAAQRVGRGPEQGAALLLERFGHDVVALLAPGVVGIDDPPLLAEVLGHPAADRPAGNGGVERFVEGERARVGLGADLVRLAHGDEEHLRLLGLLVDGHLDVGREAADDELHLLVLDQLLCPLRADCGLELVVAEEQLDLAPEDAVLRVQLVRGELGAPLLIGRQGPEWSREREREADADGFPALAAQDGGEC